MRILNEPSNGGRSIVKCTSMERNVVRDLLRIQAFCCEDMLQFGRQVLHGGCKRVLSQHAVEGILHINEDDGKRHLLGFDHFCITAKKQRGKHSLLPSKTTELSFHAVLRGPWKQLAAHKAVVKFSKHVEEHYPSHAWCSKCSMFFRDRADISTFKLNRFCCNSPHFEEQLEKYIRMGTHEGLKMLCLDSI